MSRYNSKLSQGYRQLKPTQYMRLRLATIIRVDYAKMTVDIKYLQENGGRTEVPVTTAYWSSHAFMGVVPEVGAHVVIGFYHYGANLWNPVILTYLPNSVGSARRVESQQIGLPPESNDDLARIGTSRVERTRLRKSYPGQPLITSKEGSDLYLSDDVLLSNSRSNEIILRSDDQTIVTGSVNLSQNVSGGFINFGAITRNAFVLDDHIYQAGKSLIDPSRYESWEDEGLTNPIVLPNGKKVNYICDVPSSPHDGGTPYTEYRISLKEFNPLINPINENTDLLPESDADKYLVDLIMGTYSGYNPDNPSTYGRILKPIMYKDLLDSKGSFRFEEARKGSLFTSDESKSSSSGYYLRVGQYQQSITKTGNTFISIPASTSSDALGSGVSAQVDMAGSLKMTLGKEDARGGSLYLNAEGSANIYLGKDHSDENGNKSSSLNIHGQGSINLTSAGSDSDGYSMTTSLAGNEYKDVGGSSETVVKGDCILRVYGTLHEEVMGKKIEGYTQDKSTTYGGDYTEIVLNKKQGTIAKGRTNTIYSGGDELTILEGSKKYTLMAGDWQEEIVVGNSTETLRAGSKSIHVASGDYNVNVTTGGVHIQTSIGSILVETSAGSLDIKATGVVTIKGGIVNVESAQVNLGAAGGGGVVTSNHPCLVTGAPHIGSFTVKASL